MPLCLTEYRGAFPSGQRGQTVNLLHLASVVRIHPLPPERLHKKDAATKNPDKLGVFHIFRVKKTKVGFMDENHLFPKCVGI